MSRVGVKRTAAEKAALRAWWTPERRRAHTPPQRRVQITAAKEEEGLGGLCPHGKSRYQWCRPCQGRPQTNLADSFAVDLSPMHATRRAVDDATRRGTAQ